VTLIVKFDSVFMKLCDCEEKSAVMGNKTEIQSQITMAILSMQLQNVIQNKQLMSKCAEGNTNSPEMSSLNFLPLAYLTAISWPPSWI